MKKYRLKLQYKIMLYLIALLSLLYILSKKDTSIIIITIYYIILYNMITAINDNIETTKKEDNRTAKFGKSSNK